MSEGEFSVRVSFLEIYNEELFDLLSPVEDQNKLRLFEDSTRKGSVVIQGLEEVIVRSKVHRPAAGNPFPPVPVVGPAWLTYGGRVRCTTL